LKHFLLQNTENVLLRTEIHVLLIAFANIGVVIAVDEYQDQ